MCARNGFWNIKKKIKKTSQVIAVQSYAKRLAKRLNAWQFNIRAIKANKWACCPC